MHPGVALGLAKVKQIKFISSLIYIFAQCLGAVLAAAFVYLQFPQEKIDAIQTNQANFVNEDVFKMFIFHFMTMFFLGFGLCAVIADERATPEVYGLGYGAMITVSYLANAGFYGPCLNLLSLIGSIFFLNPTNRKASLYVCVIADILGPVLGMWIYNDVFNNTTVQVDSSLENKQLEMMKIKAGMEGEALLDDDNDEVSGRESEMQEVKEGGNNDQPVEVEVDLDVDGGEGNKEGEGEGDGEVELEVKAEAEGEGEGQGEGEGEGEKEEGEAEE